MMKNILFYLLFVLLVSCGGGRDTSNQSPIINSQKDIKVIQGESKILRLNANDPDGQIVSYLWMENKVLLSNANTLNTQKLTRGLHKIIVEVTDDKGAKTKSELVVKVGRFLKLETKVLSFDSGKVLTDTRIQKYVYIEQGENRDRILYTSSGESLYQFEYNDSGQIISDGTNIYTYDAKKRLIQYQYALNDEDSYRYSYRYDAGDNVIEAFYREPINSRPNYRIYSKDINSYNSKGSLLTSKTYFVEEKGADIEITLKRFFSYKYDKNNRLVERVLLYPKSRYSTITNTYNQEDGSLSFTLFGSDMKLSRVYNTDKRLALKTLVNETTGENIFELKYSYNDVGDIILIKSTSDVSEGRAFQHMDEYNVDHFPSGVDPLTYVVNDNSIHEKNKHFIIRKDYPENLYNSFNSNALYRPYVFTKENKTYDEYGNLLKISYENFSYSSMCGTGACFFSTTPYLEVTNTWEFR